MSPASRRPRAAVRVALGGLALTLATAALVLAAGAKAGAGTRGVVLSAKGQPGAPASAAGALPALHFGVRLVDVPVDEARNPRAYRYVIDFLPTGSVIERRVMIVNDEPRTAHFTVYAAAAQISGGEFIGESGRARNELTGWITVGRPSLTLTAGQSAMDLITIRVPPGATQGEHYAVIWAEQAETARATGSVAIREVARVGVRVYLAVGRGGAPPTSFTIITLASQRSAAGQPSLIAHVRDTGGRAVDLSGQLRLTNGPGGSSAGPFPAGDTVTLAPGQSGNVTFALPATLPDGPWLATVTLVSGLTTATARGTVVFGVPLAAASWVGPVALAWGGGMLLGLIVIGAVAADRFRRPRRSPA